MNEYLTTLTSGGLLALLAVLMAFFWFAPDNGRHKKSLYQMTAMLYLVLFLQTFAYVVAMYFYPQEIMVWQLNMVADIPAIPFIVFVVMEMLYPDKRVGWRTIIAHTSAPLLLMAAYLLAYIYAPQVSIWVMGLVIVWVIAYAGIMLPRAVIRYRRYEALEQEVFVDSKGHSLEWMARLSAILFVLMLGYAIFTIFDLTFLTTWIYNVAAFFVSLVWGLQIWQMHRTDAIQLDESETESEVSSQKADETEDTGVVVDESRSAKFVAELEQWLMTNDRLQSNDLNREMVARAMRTNHVTLARMLREQTGMTLAQYVTDLRLREAERLLVNTNLTIEEIYNHVGYQTRSTFSRAFQERNNTSASEWRESHKKITPPRKTK